MVRRAVKALLTAFLAFALFSASLLIEEAGALTLSTGSKGSNVQTVTKRLYDLGYLSRSQAGKSYTTTVKNAVICFQITAGIKPTGKVDDSTWLKMKSPKAPKKVKYTTLSKGANGSKVQTMKKRLYNLGYLEKSQVSKKYDDTTVKAVKSFQKAMSLSTSGKADAQTLTYLFSSLAKENPSSVETESPTPTPTPTPTASDGGDTPTPTPTTYKDLKYGLKKNSAVKKMQERLKVLGYISYSGSASGNYETKTATAVEKFQKKAKLTVNKKLASASMQKELYSDDAPNNSTTIPTNTSGDVLKPVIGTVYVPDWASEKSQYFDTNGIFAVGKTATVVDIDTGICYRVKRKGGLNHADIEPLTAYDTWQMYRTYSNKWSWARRAIWVVVDDSGMTLAASGNGMPHETSTIKDNGVDGHFCIHFKNSRTHGTNKVDSDHQKMVNKAATADVAKVQAKIDAQ